MTRIEALEAVAEAARNLIKRSTYTPIGLSNALTALDAAPVDDDIAEAEAIGYARGIEKAAWICEYTGSPAKAVLIREWREPQPMSLEEIIKEHINVELADDGWRPIETKRGAPPRAPELETYQHELHEAGELYIANDFKKIIDYWADWLVDAVATATQDRRFSRGDEEEDKVATEALFLNGCKAIQLALTHGATSIVDALTVLDATPVDDGWCPIETAPKDGTIFDVWLSDASDDDCSFYCQDGTRRSAGWCWTQGKFRPFMGGLNLPIFVKPTHWRPLPPPPTIEKKTAS